MTRGESSRSHPEFRLVVCGLHGFFSGPLHDLRESLGLRDSVDFPGWIPRADLHDLFARASASPASLCSRDAPIKSSP